MQKRREREWWIFLPSNVIPVILLFPLLFSSFSPPSCDHSLFILRSRPLPTSPSPTCITLLCLKFECSSPPPPPLSISVSFKTHTNKHNRQKTAEEENDLLLFSFSLTSSPDANSHSLSLFLCGLLSPLLSLTPPIPTMMTSCTPTRNVIHALQSECTARQGKLTCDVTMTTLKDPARHCAAASLTLTHTVTEWLVQCSKFFFGKCLQLEQ